ncbi:MAG TPA: hypothetical protein GXX39_02690 [Syntrophothermus lipocalidus]|uniref:hypothetical protein n=1 Tax=Syntrophothermus lipocalidus TaxID=86170 RepID=UPI00059C061E|nr:hypothetical protein [Syntrophothermus lipocalidus]HHV76263.1 hypothetical protein [Syntrophothermus lipocalidus]
MGDRLRVGDRRVSVMLVLICILMNFELIKAGYPPAIIKKRDRLRYYEALDEAHIKGDYRSFTLLVARCVERSLDWWLETLGN